MVVAMTEDARTSGQFGRDVIQFDFQFCRLAVLQLLAAQAAKVMFEKEIQLPGKLRLVKGQAACD